MSNVTQPQSSSNGAANGNGTLSTLDRPDRLNLHAVWAQLERLHNDVQAAKVAPPKGQDAPLFKIVLAIIAGCTTPVLALAMSTLTGTVASADSWSAWFALLPAAVLIALLIVSTPHIYEAMRQLGWSAWQSRSLAIALDCAIVASELLAVWCHDQLGEVWWLPKVVILLCVAYSATLNSYVNLLHAGWSRVTDPRKR